MNKNLDRLINDQICELTFERLEGVTVLGDRMRSYHKMRVGFTEEILQKINSAIDSKNKDPNLFSIGYRFKTPFKAYLFTSYEQVTGAHRRVTMNAEKTDSDRLMIDRHIFQEDSIEVYFREGKTRAIFLKIKIGMIESECQVQTSQPGVVDLKSLLLPLDVHFNEWIS